MIHASGSAGPRVIWRWPATPFQRLIWDLCFDAQQAAEKAVKAVFIKRGETFPYSHDLNKLLRLLEKNGLKIPQYVNEAKELTQYAHLTRYPSLADPVTPRQHRRAVRIATAVLRWAERLVG